MEIGGNRGQSVNGSNINSNSTSTSLAWDVWELNSNSNSSRMDWTSTSTTSAAGNGSFYAVAGDGTFGEAGGAGHAQLHHHDHRHEQDHQQTLYGCDGGSHPHPDPHLVCLKLGKRHYFEDVAAAAAAAAEGAGPVPTRERRVAGFPMGSAKKGKGCNGGGGGGGGAASSVSVPRCQVEGCHVALVNAKDYYRRHKVCEMHSKAPKVVVLGLEQRFCQQCSRFHVVSEFEESKRSCKRRLAGHNERRRKSSHDSIARNSSHHENKVILGGGFPYLTSPTGRALSLLSSKADSWVPPSDLSSRSSAALRELIAENRTAILARQLFLERDTWHSHNHHHHQQQQAEDLSTELQQRGGFGATIEPHHHPMFPQPPAHGGWERINESGAHVTLDLMQAPSPAFGFLPARGKAKVEEEECSDLWNSFQGPNLV